MSLVYLSLGSNLGDRFNLLREATTLLQASGFQRLKASSFYETEPIGFLPSEAIPWFLNQVLYGEWDKTPMEILSVTQAIESQLGRDHKTLFVGGKRNYFSRSMDIDILLVEDRVVENEFLQLPHPRFHARRYDLIPLVEIAPEALHPVFKLSFLELLNRCKTLDTVRLYESS